MSSKNQRYLYRGVNHSICQKLAGRLIPKAPGKLFHDFARMGQLWAICESVIQCGDGAANEGVRHQLIGRSWLRKELGTPVSVSDKAIRRR